MARIPPFTFNEDMVKNPKELVERLNAMFRDVYQTKDERTEYQPPSSSSSEVQS